MGQPGPGEKGGARLPAELRAALRGNALKAMDTIIEVMANGKPAERMKAAELILERACGKAGQPAAGEAADEAADVDLFDAATRRKLINEYIDRQRPGN